MNVGTVTEKGKKAKVDRRFDALMLELSHRGIKAQQLVNATFAESVRQRRYVPHPAISRRLREFRKLTRARQLEVATDFLRRNPKVAMTYEEEAEQRRRENPLLNVFAEDINGPASSFYDAGPGEWFTSCVSPERRASDNGDDDDTSLSTDDWRRDTIWRLRDPMAHRIVISLTLPSRAAVVESLVHLARQTRMAFRVSYSDVKNGLVPKYAHVLMPKGDRRAEVFATKPENAYEVDGLPIDTALLFWHDEPFENGLIVEYPINRTTTHFGATVRAPLYAVQFESMLFERRVTLPIRSA